jgi:hypothetical protein
VPGINAPPFPQDSANQNIQQEIAEEEQSQGKTGTIQEEVEEEIQLADGKTAVVNVQTIYSR